MSTGKIINLGPNVLKFGLKDDNTTAALSARDRLLTTASPLDTVAGSPTTEEILRNIGQNIGHPGKTAPTDFADLTPAQREMRVDAAEREFDRTADPASFDGIDTFRQHLSPEQQRDYDTYLDDIRSNDDINIRYWDGAQPDALTDELIYRGIAASTFGNPDRLDDATEVAEQYELFEHPDWSTGNNADRHGVSKKLTNSNGQFDVYVYPDGTNKIPLGQVVSSGDLFIDQGGLKSVLISGSDNAIIHEFAHVEQGIAESRSLLDKVLGRDGDPEFNIKPLPAGFPDEDLFFERV